MKNKIIIFLALLLVCSLSISWVSASNEITDDNDTLHRLCDINEVDSYDDNLEIVESDIEDDFDYANDLNGIETHEIEDQKSSENKESDILKYSESSNLGAKIATDFSIPNTFSDTVTPTLMDSSGKEIMNTEFTYNFDDLYFGKKYSSGLPIEVSMLSSKSYHILTLNYTGNGTYYSCVKKFKFYKNGSRCTVSDLPADATHFEVPSEVTNRINVALKDSSGKLITNASICYYLDGNSNQKYYVTNGNYVSLNFIPNTNHKITLQYAGKELLYEPCNGTFSFHIRSSVIVNEAGMYYTEGGMNVPYSLYRDGGSFAESGEIFAPFGKSTISIYNRFTSETLNKVVNVKKRILESEDLSINYADIIEYRVRVADANDNFTSGLNVSYTILNNNNAVASGYAISDDDGFATFRIHLKAANYTIKNYYCGVVNYNDLEIKPVYIDNKYKEVFLNSVTTYFDDSRQILNFGWKGNFKGILKIYKDNKLVKSINLDSTGYIYDYFTYKSVKKSFNTNNLKSLGTFKAQITDAKGTILASSTIKILKNPTKVVAKNIKSYIGKKITAKIYVKNKETDSKITVGTVKLTFNGKSYSAKISDGLAKFTLKMPSKAKTYKSTIKFLANEFNFASSAVMGITVKKIPSEVFEYNDKFYAKTNTNVKLKVHVYYKDETKSIKRGTVKFTFKGKKYKVKLVNGIATLKIKMPSKAGTYKYKVKYLGSSKFASSSYVFSVIVKKKLSKGQYMDWCHGGGSKHKAVWTKKYYGKSLVGTVKINGVLYNKYVKLYKFKCICNNKQYHSHKYTYQTVSATNSPKYVYKKVKYKTISVGAKLESYVTKKSGKYKAQTYFFRNPSMSTLCMFLYRKGKLVDGSHYLTKYHYKSGGKWHWTKWRGSYGESIYHKTSGIDNNVKINKVKFKFLNT